MAGLGNNTEDDLLDHITKKAGWTVSYCAISLHTGDPGETGANECANSNNYARLNTAAGDWNAASSGIATNNGTLTFATPSGSWGAVTHFGLWDSTTYGGGNYMIGGSLSDTYNIGNGDTVRFGDQTITLDASAA